MANSIPELLMEANMAIENTLNDPEILAAVTEFGYDEAAVNAGKVLYDNTNQLQQQQLKEYGDQYSATSAFKTKLAEAKSSYMRFVKIARIAFKNDYDVFQKLGLTGARKHSFSGWFAQVEQFYNNALSDPDVMAKFSKFGVTQEKLEQGKQLALETQASDVNKKKEIGEAQQATLTRDTSADALDDWLGDYKAIAKIALEDKPQLLEKLGILVRS